MEDKWINPPKNKCRLHQFGVKIVSRLHWTRPACSRRLDWRLAYLFIAERDELEENVASEVHVKRFKANENGNHKVQNTDGFLEQKYCVQNHVLRGGREPSGINDAGGEPPTPFAAEGSFTMKRLTNMSSLRPLVIKKARNDFWSSSGNCMYRHHVILRYIPEESSSRLLSSDWMSPDRQGRILMSSTTDRTFSESWCGLRRFHNSSEMSI